MDENFEEIDDTASTPGYDNGWRSGMFDKCNNRTERSFDKMEFSIYNVDYVAGYRDGYDCNERKI